MKILSILLILSNSLLGSSLATGGLELVAVLIPIGERACRHVFFTDAHGEDVACSFRPRRLFDFEECSSMSRSRHVCACLSVGVTCEWQTPVIRHLDSRFRWSEQEIFVARHACSQADVLYQGRWQA